IAEGRDHLLLGDPAEEGPRILALLALVAVEVEEGEERLAGALGRDLDDVAAGLGPRLVRAAAGGERVLGHLPAAADVAHGPVEADRGDVVLAAGVGAAGDLDVEAAGELDALGRLPRALEEAGEVAGEAHRRGDREVAGVGAGAGDD